MQAKFGCGLVIIPLENVDSAYRKPTVLERPIPV